MDYTVMRAKTVWWSVLWSLVLVGAVPEFASADLTHLGTNWTPIHCRASSRDIRVGELNTLHLRDHSLPSLKHMLPSGWTRQRHRWLRNLWASQPSLTSAEPALVSEFKRVSKGPAAPQWGAADRTCNRSSEIVSLVSPRSVVKGDEVSIMFASDSPVDGMRVLVTRAPTPKVGLCGIDLVSNTWTPASVWWGVVVIP